MAAGRHWLPESGRPTNQLQQATSLRDSICKSMGGWKQPPPPGAKPIRHCCTRSAAVSGHPARQIQQASSTSFLGSCAVSHSPIQHCQPPPADADKPSPREQQCWRCASAFSSLPKVTMTPVGLQGNVHASHYANTSSQHETAATSDPANPPASLHVEEPQTPRQPQHHPDRKGRT